MTTTIPSSIRDRLDDALRVNNALAEHLTRAAALQQTVCDDLLAIVAELDATEPEPEPETVLCPIEPEDRDMAPDLVEWITGLEPGTHATFGADTGHSYRVDTTVDVTALSDVTIADLAVHVVVDSAEHHPTTGVSQRRHLRFRLCSGLHFERIRVRGQNVTDDDGNPIPEDGQARYDPGRPFEHALAVEDCDAVSIFDLDADAIFGDGLYLRRVTTVSASKIRVSRNGRQGIAVVACQGVSLLALDIIHSRRSGIDLEPNFDDELIDDVEIGNARIRSRLIPITRGGQGTSRNVFIHDIESTWTDGMILHIGGDENFDWRVARWTETREGGSPAPRIRAQRIVGLEVTDVIAPCKPSREMTGVGLKNASDIALTRCLFPGAAVLVAAEGDGTYSGLTAVDCEPSL